MLPVRHRMVGHGFNPAQAISRRASLKPPAPRGMLLIAAFDEFAARSDLPEFDFIGLHGIWSWISDENRGVIADFLRKRLAVGGVAYISYKPAGLGRFRPDAAFDDPACRNPRRARSRRCQPHRWRARFRRKAARHQPELCPHDPTLGDRLARVKGQNAIISRMNISTAIGNPMHFATMADVPRRREAAIRGLGQPA